MNFKLIQKIIKKNQLNSDDEELLLDICMNKHVNKDYRKGLINVTFNKQLMDYKNKFKYHTLQEICSTIDESIMKYDQNNKKKDIVYDNDFLNLLKNLEKLKFDDKNKEKYFSYYWNNRIRMSFSCYEKEKMQKLMSYINNNNLDRQLYFMEIFKDEKSMEILNEYLKLCDWDVSKFLAHFTKSLGFGPLVELIINLKFTFKT